MTTNHAPRTTLARLLEAREPRPGALRTGPLELEWSTTRLRVRSTDGEPWLELGEGELGSVQLSRSQRPAPGVFNLLRGRLEHRLHAELRTADGAARIQLAARVAEAELLEGLPALDSGGTRVALEPLLDLIAVCRGLGATLAVWNPGATARDADATPPPLLADEPFALAGAFLQPIDAHMARIALEGEGLEVRVEDEHTVSIDPLASVALGGVKILVRASQLEAARSILLRRGS